GPDRLRQRRPHVALVLRPARLDRGDQQGPHGALRFRRRGEVLLVHLELPGRYAAARRSAAPPVNVHRPLAAGRRPCPTSPSSGTPAAPTSRSARSSRPSPTPW